MINRETYLEKIRPFFNKDLVKVLTGIRRSGKSTLLKLIQQELVADGVLENQIYSINFESMTYANRDINSIYDELKDFAANKNGKLYIFLDEIQELNGWERMVNSLRVDLICDLYITGSNSKLLSGEMATYLVGRYVEIPVYTFSFQEIVNMKHEKEIDRPLEQDFKNFLKLGGMPFLHDHELDEKPALEYLKDIYRSIILKDIVARYSIRDIELLERIITYLLANVANSFSGPNLIKYLKNAKRTLSLETIYNYIAYAREACLLYLLPRIDIQGKGLLKFQEKIFMADQGIREAIYGHNERDINQVLENIVCLELLRRDFNVYVGKFKEKEVDFIAEKHNQKIYIQVAYLIADQSVARREFSILAGIQDNYPKLVLSLDSFDFSRKGIIHKNLIDFLLQKDWF